MRVAAQEIARVMRWTVHIPSPLEVYRTTAEIIILITVQRSFGLLPDVSAHWLEDA